MKNFILAFGKFLLEVIALIGVILASVVAFYINDFTHGTYSGLLIFFAILCLICFFCFRLFLLVNIDDNLAETKNILKSVHILLDMMRDNSNSMRRIQEDNALLFRDAHDDIANMNKVLNEYLRNKANEPNKKVFAVRKTQSATETSNKKEEPPIEL